MTPIRYSQQRLLIATAILPTTCVLYTSIDGASIRMSRETNPIPRQIKRQGLSGLLVTWSDNSESQLSSETLRRQCPCAECREKRGDDSHAKPLTGKKRSLSIVQNTREEQLGLESIWGIGQYAIGIRWNDGHDSGIYTFEFLAQLAGRSVFKRHK